MRSCDVMLDDSSQNYRFFQQISDFNAERRPREGQLPILKSYILTRPGTDPGSTAPESDSLQTVPSGPVVQIRI